MKTPDSHFLLTLNLEHLVDGIYEQQRDEDKGNLETVLHLGDDFCELGWEEISCERRADRLNELTRLCDSLEESSPPGERKRNLKRGRRFNMRHQQRTPSERLLRRAEPRDEVQ